MPATPPPPRDWCDHTHRQQVNRLRKLAELALTQYDLKAPTLTAIHHAENTTFRVDVPVTRKKRREAGPHTPGRYLLRVQRHDYNSPAEIRGELMWLKALRRDGFVVPEPVPATNGKTLLMLQHPAVPFARPVSLMRWVPGRFVHRRTLPVHYERVGGLMARLHNHASAWKPPKSFVRRRWDYNEYFVSETGWGGGASYNWTQIPRTYRPLFKRVQRAAEKGMAELGEGPEVWGLIHADLHFHNVLMQDGAAHAIDFDDCGYGHYLYDLAVVLNRVPEHTDDLLRGYRRHRPLDDDYLAYLPLYCAIRNVSVILWLGGRQVEVPGLRPIYAPLLERFSANIRKWMGW